MMEYLKDSFLVFSKFFTSFFSFPRFCGFIIFITKSCIPVKCRSHDKNIEAYDNAMNNCRYNKQTFELRI